MDWLATPVTDAAETATVEASPLASAVRGVVAAIATAIGVVGLATLVGGGVTWIRMSQIGIPTQTALSVTPRRDLVVLGATSLSLYVGLAILVVALLFATDPTGRVTGFTLLALFLMGGAAIVYVLVAAYEWWSRALLIGAIVVLVAACARVGPMTGRRFLPFGIAVFFAVLLFGAATTYRFEADHVKVQPAAIVPAEGPGLIGFFVASTNDKIYLARTEQGERLSGLFEFNRDAQTLVAVGRRFECDFGRGTTVACSDALIRAGELRKKLLSDRRRLNARPQAKPKKTR
jgi:hypothetical protein